MNAIPLFGSWQVGDILIWDGDTMITYSFPLEEYLNVESLRNSIQEFRPGCSSTACYRGYQAEWEISEGQLFLTKLKDACGSVLSNSEMAALFYEYHLEGQVKGNWFTSNILAYSGRIIHAATSGYPPFFEKQYSIEFKSGKVVGLLDFNNSKSRVSPFVEDNWVLKDFIYSNLNWQLISCYDKEKIIAVFSIKSSDIGKPTFVEIKKSTGVGLLDQEFERVIRMIPDWNVYYFKGEPVMLYWNIPIIIDEEKRKKYAD